MTDTNPASNYVAYHSEDLMGGPLSLGPPYEMLTRKPAARLMSKRVWVIAGRGRKKQYFLKQHFIVDAISEIADPNFRFRFSGQDGVDFTPEIPLSPLPCFNEFLKTVANFSLGVTEMKLEYLALFTEAAGLLDNQVGRISGDWQLVEGEIAQSLRTFRSRSSLGSCVFQSTELDALSAKLTLAKHTVRNVLASLRCIIASLWRSLMVCET